MRDFTDESPRFQWNRTGNCDSPIWLIWNWKEPAASAWPNLGRATPEPEQAKPRACVGLSGSPPKTEERTCLIGREEQARVCTLECAALGFPSDRG